MGERLKDKVAIVTGAGSIGPGWGNGKATAVLYAREGAKVVSADINREAAEETAGIIRDEGGEVSVFEADVARSDQVAALVEHTTSRFGRIDILHNNVGIIEVGGPVEISEDGWDKVINVNLKSMYLTCRKRPAAHGSARVRNDRQCLLYRLYALCRLSERLL